MGQGGTKTKAAVWVVQLGVAKFYGGKTGHKGQDKTTKLLQLKGTFEDETTCICASLACWVYTTGRELVRIKDAHGNRAAAYRSVLDMSEDGYIEDGRVLAKIGECKHTNAKGEQEMFVQLRFLGMAVYVKKKHVQILNKQAIQEDDQTADEVANALKPVLPTDTAVRTARFRHNGALLPSGVTVVLHDAKEGFTVLVSWQGTQADQRPMDLFTDASGVPILAPLWFDQYPDLRAHSGMYGIMQTEFLLRQKELTMLLRDLAKKGKVRLIFTGHSLGGGIALLAHMASLAEVEKLRKSGDLGDLARVELGSIVFAAPMVFHYEPPEEGSGPEKRGRGRSRQVEGQKRHEMVDSYKELQEAFRSTSVNFVCDKDVVPRLPGHPLFAKSAVKFAATSLAREISAKQLGIAEGSRCLDAIEDFAKGGSAMFLDNTSMGQTWAALRQFRHLSTINHWKANLDEGSFTCDSGEDLGKEFVEEPGDDYKYLLACHSWFPNNIQKKSTS